MAILSAFSEIIRNKIDHDSIKIYPSVIFDTIYADNDTLLIPNLLIHAAIVFGCYLILPGKLFIEIRLIRISDSIQNLLYTHIRSN